MSETRPPLVLAILDGYGLAPPSRGNAIRQADTPTMDALTRQFPSTRLAAAGPDVGLPAGQVGNSEAGHLNIGGGRVVLQDSVRISRAITNGTFFKNPALLQAIQAAVTRRSKLHLMGLVSAEQSAHADPDHLLALLTLVRLKRVPRVFLHLFTDGRDANPTRGLSLVEKIERGLPSNVTVATIMGRSYAMDRKKDWKRTALAYHCLTRGEGLSAATALEAVRDGYERGQTDEFIFPTVITPVAKTGRIGPRDSVIFFNLRSDRARQLTKAFVQANFNARNPGAFRRKVALTRIRFIAMTDFGPDLGPVLTAFPSIDVQDSFPIAVADRRQLYIAESEKYAHMTYFFNGGFDHPIAGEERVVVPSPPVIRYDATPAMSASAITDVALKYLARRTKDVIGLNYANADMLGHTGDLIAAIRGVEVLDRELGRLWKAVSARGGLFVVTGDHGNAEQMIDPATGGVHTEHTANPVPLIIASRTLSRRRLRPGRLADVAPTILQALGRRPPSLMTGQSLWS